jgi:hypothetical protein
MRLGLVVYPGNCTEERATIVVTDDKYYKIFSIMGILWRPLGSTVATFATVSLVWSNLGILNGLIFALLALVFWVLLLSMCSWVLQRLTSSRVRANAFIADSRSNPDHWRNISSVEFTPSAAVWHATKQKFFHHLYSDPTNVPLQENFAQFLLDTVHKRMIDLDVFEINDLPPEFDDVLDTDIGGSVRDNYVFLQRHFGEVSKSHIRWSVEKMGEDERYYRTKRNRYRSGILEFVSEPSYVAWTIVFVWLFSVWMIGGNRVGESKADWWVYNACQFAFKDCAPTVGEYTKLDALEHLDFTLRTVYPRSVDAINPSVLEKDCWYFTREDDGEVRRAKTNLEGEFDYFEISFYLKELVDSDPEFGAEYDYYETSRWLVTPPQSASSWRIVPEIQPEYLEGEYACIP